MDDAHDQALAADLLAGDEAAFAELVRQHSGRAYAIGLSMLRNEQDARDVVQETFLNVHRRIDSFRGDAPIGAWIARIATNNCLMKLRTRRRKPETSIEVLGPRFADDGHHAFDVPDWSPLADELRESRELGEQIRAAIDALPDSYRDVIVLADYHHLSMADIAAELELTVPNVKTRLHRARLAVREALSRYLEGRL
jgi:RNA polymerase sigma-70 factor, ECF subfamily